MSQVETRVVFGKSVSAAGFEGVLKQHYGSSLRSDSTLFDFSQVEWCDAAELSLIVLWICELLAQEVNIAFALPAEDLLEHEYPLSADEQKSAISQRVRVYSYLVQSRFLDFLLSKGIMNDVDVEGRKLTRAVRPIEDGIAPLVLFDSADDFMSFMEGFRGRHYQSHFAQLTGIPVVETGEIRDIILQELGENVFEHAEGRFGHLIMTTRSPLRRDTKGEAALAARVAGSPKLARRFFQQLDSSGYITIVIADKGPGINHKPLREAYHRDDILLQRKHRPSESEMIDYAFLPWSTSRPPEERLGALLNLMEGEQTCSPTTGLFSVKEVVREYGGLLVIRSGRSIVAYDFLSYPDLGHPGRSLLTNKLDASLRSLSDFGGTQIRIYLPVEVKSASRVIQVAWRAPALSSPRRQYVLQSIMSVPGPVPMNQDEDFANWLLGIRDQLYKAQHQAQRPTVILLDCQNYEINSATARKGLAVLLQDCMRLQDERFCVVLVNVGPTIMKLAVGIGNTASIASGYLRTKALVAFDQQLQMSFLGLSDEETREFLRLLHSTPGRSSSETFALRPDLLRRVQHLLWHDPSTDSYTLAVSRDTVCGAIKDKLREELADYILDETTGIHHKSGCFIIPSGAYSEGFFELRPLFYNSATREKLTRLIRYEVELSQPDVIVTIGRSLGGIVDGMSRDTCADHIHIQEPRKRLAAIKLALLPKGHRILVVTDVIGTQRTLDTVLASCEKLEVRKILSVVDARLNEEHDTLTSHARAYSFESIVKHKLQFWHEDKPPHYRYDEIRRVDPVSDAPIRDRFRLDQPIWAQMNELTGENEFLGRILRDANALVVGHFGNSERHLLYVFLLLEVARAYRKEMTEVIKDNLTMLKNVGFPASITSIFYPNQTPAADQVAKMLSLDLGGCETAGLSYEEIEFPLSFPQGDEQSGTAVIFDDASATGRTAQRMLEFVERRGFRYILIYILCNRASRLHSHHIQKITGYGRARVVIRYLTELPIPTYSQADCPQCKDVDELVHLRGEVGQITPLGEIIGEQLEQRRVQEVATLLEPDNLPVFQSTPLEDRISEAELRIQIEVARTSLVARKGLSDIAEQHKERPDMALRLVRVVSRERSSFRNDSAIWSEVFYTNFRRRLVDACAFLLEPARMLPTGDIHSVAGVFSLLDPDRFLSYLQTIIHEIDERTVYRIVIEMLRSERIRERADHLAHVLSMHQNSAAMRPIVSYLEGNIRETRRGSEAFQAYRKLRKEELTDSSRLGGYLLALSSSRLTHGSIADAAVILDRYWQEASFLLRNEILPLLEKLALSDVALSVCDKLHQLWNEAAGLLGKCSELATVIADNKRQPEERRIAGDGFYDGLQRLRHILLKDDTGTVWRCLTDLYVDLTKVIRLCIEALETELKSMDIVLECKGVDNPIFVFGHEANVYVIVSNLLDNVAKRAFDDSSKVSIKSAQIEVVETFKKVTLIIRDNGNGLSADWKFGIGLYTIDAMCRGFCSDWHPPTQASSPYATEVRVSFFRFLPEALWTR